MNLPTCHQYIRRKSQFPNIRDTGLATLLITGVEKSQIATDFVSRRGELPQAFTDRERIYVVQHDDLKLLVKLYAAYQVSRGWRPPVIVATLDEALARLGVSVTEFGPPSAAGIL